jgi:hypothetical protein
MATPNKTNPALDGVWIESVELTPTSAVSVLNQIPANCQSVSLKANANGVTDFTVLPLLSSVPNGHIITILAGVAASEVRTPSGSTNLINNVDCSDDAVEYLLTADATTKFTKISNTVGWMGLGWTKLGAIIGAVTPD